MNPFEDFIRQYVETRQHSKAADDLAALLVSVTAAQTCSLRSALAQAERERDIARMKALAFEAERDALAARVEALEGQLERIADHAEKIELDLYSEYETHRSPPFKVSEEVAAARSLIRGEAQG